MNIENLIPFLSQSEIRRSPQPGAYERRSTVGSFSDHRDAIIHEKLARPLFLNIDSLENRGAMLPVSDALSTPRVMPEVSPRAVKQKLAAIYNKYSNAADLTVSGRRLSTKIVTTWQKAIIPAPEDKVAGIRQELVTVFEILEYCRRTGIVSFDIVLSGQNKTVGLDVLLNAVMNHEDVQILFTADPKAKITAQTYVLKYFLEEFSAFSKEFYDFMQKLKIIFTEFIDIMGNTYEARVDDGQHAININEKYVDANSPTLLLKTIGLARLNYEMIMMSARRGVKKEKLILRGQEVNEIDLHSSEIICQEALRTYGCLVSMLLLPIKYTRECIVCIIDDIFTRYMMVGRISENEAKAFKQRFQDAWPKEGVQTGTKINWDEVLKIVRIVKNLVKVNITFFQYSEWISRCLSDHAAKDIHQRIYAVSGNLVNNVKHFFSKLSYEDAEDVSKFLMSKAAAMAESMKEDDSKTAALNLKVDQLKGILGNCLNQSV